MNAPEPRPWRPGDEPPPGWRRDPKSSRELRTFRGEVKPGETVELELRHQRPFYWEGIGPALPPAERDGDDELEARAMRLPMLVSAARGANHMSLAAWFLCHEESGPALSWDGFSRGGVVNIGEPCIVSVRNIGERAHSYAFTLQGVEHVGLLGSGED